jgi:hypothetical protein
MPLEIIAGRVRENINIILAIQEIVVVMEKDEQARALVNL